MCVCRYDETLGGTPPAGGWDIFKDLIWVDELSRVGAGGVVSAFQIYTMAMPPILAAGSQYIKDKVVKDVLTEPPHTTRPHPSE
jgi:acyl-CoA dehydrogenase